jgi:uncharacterized protein YqgC (DUF456 family)
MEYVWMTLCVVCALVGVVGAIVPMLPGPPVSYVALWMMWLVDKERVSAGELVLMGVLMAVITVVDYIAPMWMTKIGGGSKRSIRGATLGMIVGLFLGPLGMIFGPFAGALIGEMSAGGTFSQSLKVALLSFLAFILTTGMKFIYGVAVIAMLVVDFWNIWC